MNNRPTVRKHANRVRIYHLTTDGTRTPTVRDRPNLEEDPTAISQPVKKMGRMATATAIMTAMSNPPVAGRDLDAVGTTAVSDKPVFPSAIAGIKLPAPRRQRRGRE